MKHVCHLCHKVVEDSRAIHVDGKIFHYPTCYHIYRDIARALNPKDRWMIGRYED